MKIRKNHRSEGKASFPFQILKKAKRKIVGRKDDDSVDHPKHYQGNKLEVIDIIEDFDLSFCLGNAIKYILRAGKKIDVVGDRDLDLKKAVWYINRALEQEKE